MKHLLLPIIALATATACQSAGDAISGPPAMGPGSTEVLRTQVSNATGLEVIISDVRIPPGATVPSHYHPGEEFVYVIEGSAIHVEAGKPDHVLRAGDAYVIPPEATHAPRGGPEGARAIVFRLHSKDLPERVNLGAHGPIPDISDLTLRSSPEGLAQLLEKVRGRPDADCRHMASPTLICHIAGGRELYVFTEPGSMEHPSALFRGFVMSEDGPQLQERGWSAVDDELAQRFFASVRFWPETGVSN